MDDEIGVDDKTVDDELGSPLMDAFSLVNGARNRAYGDFWTDYERTAALFRVLTHDQPVTMDAVHADLFMICVKLSRLSHKIENGMAYEDPSSCLDDITDANGYFEGLWKILNHPEVFLVDDDDDDDSEEEGDDDDD